MTRAETVLRKRFTMEPEQHASCDPQSTGRASAGKVPASTISIEPTAIPGGDPGNGPNMEYLFCPRCGAATVGRPLCPNCGFPHDRKGGAA